MFLKIINTIHGIGIEPTTVGLTTHSHIPSDHLEQVQRQAQQQQVQR